MQNVQNNIQFLLKQNSIIPVVTINDMDEIEPIIYSLLEKNIKCIEVTLRTEIAFEAIEFIKNSYGEKICVGAGTVINIQQIDKLEKIGVDFIVCPGLSSELVKSLLNCKIPLEFRGIFSETLKDISFDNEDSSLCNLLLELNSGKGTFKILVCTCLAPNNPLG